MGSFSYSWLHSDFTPYEKFTTYNLPLATSTDSSLSSNFVGVSVERAPIFKVNGNLWTVTFDSALGDVNAMTATGTKYLTSGTALSVYDDVVEGSHPLTHNLYGLETGVDVHARVSAYTRGALRGYSDYSSHDAVETVSTATPSYTKIGLLTDNYTLTPTHVTSGVPNGAPPTLANSIAEETLQVSEVQTITVGASHLREVQTVTTSATAYSEVQTITSSADRDQTIAGQFTMRIPEVQIITVAASTSLTNAYTKFTYKYKYITTADPPLISTNTNTDTGSSCLDLVTDSADDLKSHLESISGIDAVEVVKSGHGGYSDDFGYVFTVTFSGDEVAGNVELLTATTFSDASCTSGSAPHTVSVSTRSENKALGLDTEIHTITVNATTDIAQGQYLIGFADWSAQRTGSQANGCVEWNATATELQSAIEALNVFDHVFVERFDSGHGYIYSVYFTGNMLHRRGLSEDQNPTSQSYDTGKDTFVMVETSNSVTCDAFAYFDGGVLTTFASSSDHSSSVESELTRNIRDTNNQYLLDLTSTSSSDLSNAMALMPSWVVLDDVRTSIADDQGGITWTMVFGESMGNVEQFICSYESGVSASGFACSDNTVIEGNYIGGYFVVGTSALIAADATASQMQTALESLTDFGEILVSRTGPTNQGGYTWTVTWATASGNQDPLTFANSLTGSGVTITGTTLQDGNELGGTYTLEYAGSVTSSIPYSATADELDAALTSLVGAVSVTRTATTTEGGSSYSVTFTGLTGDVSPLVPYYSSTLTGVGAVVKIMTETQGSAATGTQLKVSFDAPTHCSKSQVPSGECGDPITAYSLEIGTSSTARNIILPLTPNYDVQYIRIASLDLWDYLYFDGIRPTGTFQLSYKGATSGALRSDASATDIREALESLPDINTVHVTRDYAGEELGYKVAVSVGDTSLSCATGYSCAFDIPAGDLIKVGGQWFKVRYDYDFITDTSGVLPLAEVTDATAGTTFTGSGSTTASIYRWTRGYEWAVTFLDTVGDSIEAIGSPQHALAPVTSTVSIRASDCTHCAYITGLSVWTNYFLAVRAQNSRGYSGYATTTAQPKEVPGAPTHVSSSSVSGSEIEVHFSPPTGDSSDVMQYTVEWDTNQDFTSLYNTSLTPSCSTAGYGQCQITGSSLDGIPPYSYLVQYLTSDTAYYVRVAARNSISITSGMTDENTYWSAAVTSTTADQAPSAPVSVETLLAGPTQIQVLITEPLSNGGASVVNYVIESSASSAFDDSTTYATTTQAVSGLPDLETGVKVYEITGLTAGNSYWVRVSATNSIGTGATTMSTSAVAVATKAGGPASASLTTAT